MFCTQIVIYGRADGRWAGSVRPNHAGSSQIPGSVPQWAMRGYTWFGRFGLPSLVKLRYRQEISPDLRSYAPYSILSSVPYFAAFKICYYVLYYGARTYQQLGYTMQVSDLAKFGVNRLKGKKRLPSRPRQVNM